MNKLLTGKISGSEVLPCIITEINDTFAIVHVVSYVDSKMHDTLEYGSTKKHITAATGNCGYYKLEFNK